MIRKLIARQFRRPSGLLGHYAANFMKKNNQDYFAAVCELLEIRDNDAILEIGCGAGYAIKLIMDKNNRCTVNAIDFSTLMLKKAKSRNRKQVADGRVRIFKGDFREYDFGNIAYEKIFAINVIYFWNDLETQLIRIYKLLKHEGRLVLYMSSPERLRKIPFAVDEVFNKYTIDQVEAVLAKAGFKNVTHETVVKMGCETYYVIAEK